MTDLTESRFDLHYENEPARVIRGRVTRPAGEGRVPFVLVLHGFKGFMDWGFFPLLARRLAEAGLAAVAFNTSGSGIGPDLAGFTDEQAFEKDTVTRQLEDFARVRAHVALGAPGGLAGLDPARAGLFGHSRGGGLGLIHAAEQGDYRAVVTWAAIESVDRWDAETRALWRKLGHLPVVNSRTGQTLRMDVGALRDLELNAERFDIQAACRRLSAPTLACHGDADEAVHFEALASILGSLPPGVGRGLAVPGAGHTFGARHPMTEVSDALEEVLAKSVDWFRTHLPRGPGELV